MIRRPLPYRAGVVALLAIATLIATQPLGVFSHLVHDHLDGQSHLAHVGVAIHDGHADTPDRDADHCHVWMTPAAAVVAPQVCQPQAIAAVGPSEDTRWPSAAPFPPFSPPRA